MAQLDLVYKLLKDDLSAPRVLLDQVINYINDHYGYSAADLDRFFTEKYPTLQDYEVDLIFSPQFTPAEHNRLEYIPVLGENALLPEEVAMLKRRLGEADLYTVIKTGDGPMERALPVHEVFIERYVGLLKLDQKLPSGFYDELIAQVPQESRNEVNLLARSEAWQPNGRADILVAFLRVFKAHRSFSVPKASFLTNFVRTYRPGNLLDVERQLEALIKSCRDDMDNVSGRGFHDEYLKAMNAGSRLNQGEEKEVWAHYHHMMEMAQALKEDYQRIGDVAPELLDKARQPV